ncbi:Nucleus export brr6 [Hyphodiscus hymeniophilus]|uniref:Nucleus export brr6 n=1 Tax=Hyphodiscus hymeniophilus TaxID=353542 RepID=A0A9P6SPZ3_9HELO|nr:Nucleus export brr6 [Hyphodiscus hymeniophilus]
MFNNTSKRSHESPMDWEWQNNQGPSDPTSPFTQFKGAYSQKRGGFEPSQTKSSFIAAPSTPAPPFRNPSFTTPRKAFDPDLFSETSGAESSPGDNADVEETPELPKNLKAMTVFADDSSAKQPVFGRYGAGFLGSSPGRVEQRRGKYGNALVNKVRKRKRIEKDYAITQGTRGGSDTESDDDSRPRSKGKQMKMSGGISTLWSNFLHGIESHPNLPNVLSYYTQFILNSFFAGLVIWILWSFWATVRADVDKASAEEVSLVLSEMSICASDYVRNGCGSDGQPPALKDVCDNWKHCMERDAYAVGRAKISASTFAHIFNSFVEPISYKTMIFSVVIITGAIIVNNLAFGIFRRPAHPHGPPSYFAPQSAPSQNFQWGAPPQTPQHNIQYDIYGTPFPAIMPTQELQRSPSKGNRSPSKGNRSPSKGDRY